MREYDKEPSLSVYERSKRDVAERFKSYVTDPDLHMLIMMLAEVRGVELNEDLNQEDEFMRAAQKTFDFREGTVREDLTESDMGTATNDLIEKLIAKFKMRENTEPTNPDADVVFIPGARGIIPTNRLNYALELAGADKLRAPVWVMIGSERPVVMKPDKNGLTEIDRAGDAAFNFVGDVAKTEFELMRNTAARALNIADEAWEYFEGDARNVPHGKGFHTNYRVARTYDSQSRQVLVVSAPMLDTDRYNPNGSPRNCANTVDGFLMLADIMGMGEGSDAAKAVRAMVVTDAVFTRFQKVDAEKALARYGVAVDAVGFTREHAGMKTDWPGGEKYYVQEMLSMMRSTRYARDRLNAEA